MFGTSTASYQIEGAWNEDGKGENIWDKVVHRVPSPVIDNSTGDVACDSYHKFKEDVAMLKYLGVTHYRFSLSWSRILPTGKVGMTIDTAWLEPDTNSTKDVYAAERGQQFVHGWYARPVTLGDYPVVMKKVIAERSALQGFTQSRLPQFTKDEITYLKGTLDYLGLNYYTTFMVRDSDDEKISDISFEADANINAYQKEEWPKSATPWLRVVPWGLRKLLNWIKITYGNIPILITENGVSDDGSSLEDDARVDYYQQHLSSLKDAMDDGVNVFGFTAWSLMDNFEWLQGYSEHFGLYRVDFSSSNQTRTPKKSAKYFKNVIQYRCVLGNSTCDK
ncbi:unnamed protein product [Diabrotica balteata]|uniref:beta-glucosidase n=1 Tax=Diabrotica balteata TaxID=107213 RepID=A0A9N9XC43_DIABA|nr:unnamed protein product [Diabrotica balteata]